MSFKGVKSGFASPQHVVIPKTKGIITTNLFIDLIIINTMNSQQTLKTIAILALFLIPSAYAAYQLGPGPDLRSLCPLHYQCLTETEANAQLDDPERSSDDSCGTGLDKEFPVYKFCYREKEVEREPEPDPISLCPDGFECLTGPDAEDKFGEGGFKSSSGESCGIGWEKDHQIKKYCYSEIPLDECIDTDGGKVYDVKGSAPLCEDTCSEFSKNPQVVVRECYAEIIDDKCKVSVDYYDCNSVCEDGVCLPPTCDDWIQNQGESGVDCGGPCDSTCDCPSGYKCSTVVEAEQEFGTGSFATSSDESCGHGWAGDLQLSKYCYKKVESYDCVDSDGGADIYVKGSAPGCEDFCSSDRELQECVVSQGIDDCEVRQSSYQCEGVCKNGACQLPSCDDGIQNQDEVSIDCSEKSIYSICEDCCNNGIQDYDEEGIDCGGSDCTPCGLVPIKGRILYEDTDTATGQFKPVRHAKFHAKFSLRLCEEDPCQTPVAEAEWTTDSAGKFSFMVPRNYQSAYILFGDPNDFFDINYAVRLTKDMDGCNEYLWWISDSHTVPATGTLNFGEMKIGMNADIDFVGNWKETTDGTCSWDGEESGSVPGGSAYFNIADVALYARQYADGKRDDSDSIGYVDVQYPDVDWSNYNPTWEEITLIQGPNKDGDWTDHGFDDGVVIHEFAHHLQTTISENDDYWGDGSHTFCSYGKDEEFAWSEGFAEYFGTIVPYTYSAVSNPDQSYGMIEAPNCEEFGWEGEATVAALLWDLADDPSTFTSSTGESFDTISGRETLIFNIFDDELDNFGDAGDLCEFIEQGWNCRLSGSEKSAIDALLTSFSVDCETECDD
jgi:hypothetical protein